MEPEIRSIAAGVGEEGWTMIYWIGFEGNCDKITETGEWFEVYEENKLLAKVKVSFVDRITYKNEED
jgi:hypothetical protein